MRWGRAPLILLSWHVPMPPAHPLGGFCTGFGRVFVNPWGIPWSAAYPLAGLTDYPGHPLAGPRKKRAIATENAMLSGFGLGQKPCGMDWLADVLYVRNSATAYAFRFHLASAAPAWQKCCLPYVPAPRFASAFSGICRVTRFPAGGRFLHEECEPLPLPLLFLPCH